MKGKDFFSRKSKSDEFETPYSMTEQLLENEKFDYENKDCLECASGNNAIVNVLSKYFEQNSLIYYDIKHNIDFFKEYKKYDYIITNPPYSYWDEFVKKAKDISTKKFAFLGRLEFLTGIDRFKNNLYYDSDYPLTKIYLFVRKVNLCFTDRDIKKLQKHEIYYPELRENGKYPAGMYHYAWFIFEKSRIKLDLSILPYPQIKMINNDPYILRKENDISKNIIK